MQSISSFNTLHNEALSLGSIQHTCVRRHITHPKLCKMKISVQSVHFHADSKLLEFVEKKVSRLERLFDKIVEAEVYLKVQDTGAKVKEKVTEIRLRIPGNSSLVDKRTGATFESTVTSAVETLKRQLVRHKTKNNDNRSSERPTHLATGEVAPLENDMEEAE